jgi:hypothetical protein
MNNVAQTRTHTITLSGALPMVLAVNTCALFALEQLGGIPAWIKSAVALFLSF